MASLFADATETARKARASVAGYSLIGDSFKSIIDPTRGVNKEDYETALKYRSARQTRPTNTLGLDRSESLAKLELYALAKPHEYSALRLAVHKAIVAKTVEDIHNTVWLLLQDGQYYDPVQKAYVGIEILGGSDGKTKELFIPNLPEDEIEAISNGLARQVAQTWQKIFEEIMPKPYDKVASENVSRAGLVKLAENAAI